MKQLTKEAGLQTPGMTSPNDGIQGGLIEHVHRAVIHGLGALRCYITMLSAEGERRGRRLLDQALWLLLLAGVGVAGVVLIAFWAAQWIESRLAVPGSGEIIVGMGLMMIFLVITLARALRKERDS
jgi:hypothetical protein